MKKNRVGLLVVLLLCDCAWFSSFTKAKDRFTEFDSDKQSLLTKLEAISSGPLSATLWNIGRTPLQITASIPMKGVGPVPFVESFLKEYGLLWNIQESFIDKSIFVAPLELTPCASVLVSMKRTGLPVFNARLQFNFKDNNLISIFGFMDANSAEIPLKESTVSAEGAAQSVHKFLKMPAEISIPIEKMKPVVFDEYFVTENTHSNEQFWSFVPGVNGDAIIVNGQTGTIEVGSAGIPPASATTELGECNDSTQLLPRVTLDSLTGTPSVVSFEHLGGIKLEPGPLGASVIRELKPNVLAAMYGDTSPEAHLFEKSTVTKNNVSTVLFEQKYAGKQVEGAYLQVIVRNQKIQTIFARLPYFPYFPALQIDASSALARAEAWYIDAQCAKDEWCRSHLDSTVRSNKSVVFVPELFDSTATHPHLAFRIQFERATLWLSAHTNEILRSSTHGFSAIPFQVWNATGAPNGCNQTGPSMPSNCVQFTNTYHAPQYDLDFDLSGNEIAPVHIDSVSVKSWIPMIETRTKTLFNWDGIIGDGTVSRAFPAGNLEVVVGVDEDNSHALDSVVKTGSGSVVNPAIELGFNLTSNDILAHEYAHHILNGAYSPWKQLEQGALAEHYADVIALSVFPNANFDLGSASRLGTVRNLLNPKTANTASASYAIAHTNEKSRCDSIHSDCTYEWLGVPNRAFALIANGVPNAVLGTTPLGLEKAAQLYFETIRSGAFQIQPADRFTNQRNKIVLACASLFSPNDCENVSRAFDAVGLPASVLHGFDRFPFRGNVNGIHTVHTGAVAHQGCKISKHTLHLELREPGAKNIAIHEARSSTDSPPLFISIGTDEVVTKVISRCGSNTVSQCQNMLNREVTYSLQSKWAIDETYAFIEEEFTVPPGKPIEACVSPASVNPQTPNVKQFFWSTPISFADASAKQDIVLSPNNVSGSFSPATCALLEIGVVDSHLISTVNPRVALEREINHGSHGVRVDRNVTNAFDYTANLHLWANAFTGVFGRIVYVVSKPAGVDCQLPGLIEIPR
jgi:hypothetical protein